MGNNTMMETIDGPRFGYSKYESSVLYSNKIMNNIHITIPIILSIFGLLSLIGNILVSVYTRLQSLTSIFILNLALSDLLLTIRLPFWVSDYIWRLDLGDSVCKVYNFLSSAGFYSSMLFLVLMSIQRYMIVVHSLSGLKEGHIVTDVLTCVWVMSVLAALPITMHFKAQHYLGGCRYRRKAAIVVIMYKEIIVFVCALLVTSFCYISILRTIFKSPKDQRHTFSGLDIILVATYFICWAPYNILNFLYILDYHQITAFSNDKHLNYGIYISYILALPRCCLNPVSYGLSRLKLCKTVREIFQRQVASNPAQMGIEDCHSDSYASLNI
ncbi:chemokine XC receptor 1-like [Silurus meridionalis]|uniref:chemokine XC receptor 1-like n=1 Tax=Silurus meridionalis TaxID=175797 RepID=UPI001EE9CE88|nr:chemokine XC receptor 1-like [Silurus meridionalis]